MVRQGTQQSQSFISIAHTVHREYMGERQVRTQHSWPRLAMCLELDLWVPGLVMLIIRICDSLYLWEFSASENPFLGVSRCLPKAGLAGFGC